MRQKFRCEKRIQFVCVFELCPVCVVFSFTLIYYSFFPLILFTVREAMRENNLKFKFNALIIERNGCCHCDVCAFFLVMCLLFALSFVNKSNFGLSIILSNDWTFDPAKETETKNESTAASYCHGNLARFVCISGQSVSDCTTFACPRKRADCPNFERRHDSQTASHTFHV